MIVIRKISSMFMENSIKVLGRVLFVGFFCQLNLKANAGNSKPAERKSS